MENAQEQQENSKVPEQLRPWQFKPGQSGNPGGRPVGSVSLKQWVKNMLSSMTDEERIEYLKGLDKAEIWKMGEGNPPQKTETEVNGTLNINLISFDESDNTSQPTPEQNQG